MNAKLFFLATIILSAAIVFNSCKKKKEETPPVVETGTPTAVGTPIGTSNSATIDATGGTIFSTDGRLEIIIPANALSTATVIGIQPVTNTAFGGAGEGYDLTPVGQQFAQPVTLRFHYDSTDLVGTDFHAFGIAYQKDDHIWYLFKSAVLDSVAETESINTTHFTPYSLYRKLSVDPGFGDIKVSESLSLKVREVTFIGGSEEELPIIGQADYSQPSLVHWTLNGTNFPAIEDGNITPISNSNSTTYNAPSSTSNMTSNPAVVTAEVSGVALAGASKVYLISNVKVTGKNFNVDVTYTGTSVFMAGSTLYVNYTDFASFHLSLDTGFIADVSLIINNAGHVVATLNNLPCIGSATSEGNLLNITSVDAYYISGQIGFSINSDFIQPTFLVDCGGGAVNQPSITFYHGYDMPPFPDDDQPHTFTHDFGGGEVLTYTVTPE